MRNVLKIMYFTTLSHTFCSPLPLDPIPDVDTHTPILNSHRRPVHHNGFDICFTVPCLTSLFSSCTVLEQFANNSHEYFLTLLSACLAACLPACLPACLSACLSAFQGKVSGFHNAILAQDIVAFSDNRITHMGASQLADFHQV